MFNFLKALIVFTFLLSGLAYSGSPIRELSKRVDALTVEVDAVKAQAGSNARNIKVLNARVETLESENIHLRALIQANSERTAALEALIRSYHPAGPSDPVICGYDVTLLDYGFSKIDAIKAVRSFFPLSLYEASSLINNLPALLASNMTKEEADALKRTMNYVGASVSIEAKYCP